MAKLWSILRRRKTSRYNGNRFYTSRDMAEIKHDIAKKNSRIKRGEEKDRPFNDIAHCGCGTEGCFIHYGVDEVSHHNSGNPEKST